MVSTKLRVKELLRERRWTTKVLAEKTGLSESYLTHIKNSTRRWNEDALKKLAEAFELHPTDIFDNRNESFSKIESQIKLPNQEELAELSKKIDLQIKIVPILREIPSNPTEHNNRLLQVAGGNKDRFVPVIGSSDDSIFGICMEDNTLAPRFTKGDFLIISPQVWTRSGDIVAVEYGDQEEPTRAIMQVNYSDDFVILESLSHKQSPVALVRGKDNFRIIGKVICRYQEME